MKALIVNSSPHMDKGNTAMILNPFVDGMKTAGAEVEIVYTRKLKINPCLGCFNCWLRTPGKCVQRDDMESLLPRIGASDVLVLATPVYVDGMTGPMKNLLDRLIPLVEPFLDLRDDHCRHPVRKGVRVGKIVLVASCAFWEVDNFAPLVMHVKAICKNTGSKYAGALLRPHSAALQAMLDMGAPVTDVLDAAKDAGRQMATKGRISFRTLEIVGRELLPLDRYVEIANQSFKEELAKTKG